MLKVGIIGLGNMGKLHLLNALRIKRINVVAAADKSKKNRKYVEEHHIRAYDDYHTLIDAETLDAIIVSLPNFLKKESVFYAAENKLDIFLDKPLARSSTEAKDIVQKAEKENVRLMVGVNYRYFDSIQILKELLDEGRIGEVVIATGDLILNGPFSHQIIPKPVPDWWLSKETAGGGALLDLGYHLIDIVNWMFGDLQIEYSSLGYRFHLPVEDSATSILRSKRSSTKCAVNVGWFSRSIFPDFNFRVNLHGTAGYASTDHFAPRNLRFHAIKEATNNLLRKALRKPLNYLSYTYYYHSFFKVLDLFFESIEKDAELPISLEEQLEVVRIIEDIYMCQGVALSD